MRKTKSKLFLGWKNGKHYTPTMIIAPNGKFKFRSTENAIWTKKDGFKI